MLRASRGKTSSPRYPLLPLTLTLSPEYRGEGTRMKKGRESTIPGQEYQFPIWRRLLTRRRRQARHETHTHVQRVELEVGAEEGDRFVVAGAAGDFADVDPGVGQRHFGQRFLVGGFRIGVLVGLDPIVEPPFALAAAHE